MGDVIFEIEKNNHSFTVKVLYVNHIPTLLNFSKQVTVYQRAPAQYGNKNRFNRNRFSKAKATTYGVYSKPTRTFAFLLTVYDRFIKYLKNYGYTNLNIKLKEYKYHSGQDIEPFDIPGKTIFPGEQTQAVDFIVHQGRVFIVIPLPTGKGKTLTAIFAMQLIGKRWVCIMNDRHIGNWRKSLFENTSLKPESTVVVSGKGMSMQLFQERLLADDIGFDVLFISNNAMNNYIKSYIECSDKRSKYPIPPDQFYAKAGIYCELRDEGHENLHQVVKTICCTRVPVRIVTTASVNTKKEDFNKIFRMVYPKENQFLDFKENDHVYATAYHYFLNGIEPQDYKTGFGYNHNLFEEYLFLNNKLEGYFDMIYKISLKLYKERDPDLKFKLLIFFSRQKTCIAAKEYFEKKYTDRKVMKKIGGDPDSVLEEADIIMSTPGSCGTGRDIENLVTVINTVAIDSIIGFEQNLGRLRDIEKKTGLEQRYIYLVCENIPNHKDYSSSNRLYMRNKTRKMDIFQSGVYI